MDQAQIITMTEYSMGRLKQLAKKLKKENGMKHTDALDEASKQFGYQNFKQARLSYLANNNSSSE